MDKRGGALLAVVVAVSLLANPNVPRQGSPATQSQHAENRLVGPKAVVNRGSWTPPPPDSRCFLLKTIAEFYGNLELVRSSDAFDYQAGSKGCVPESRSQPESKSQPGSMWGVPRDKASHIRFVIATVPDPVRSHLSLFFDRTIDAIQQAAQAEDYAFAVAGMPWDGNPHEESPDLDMRLAADIYQREKEKLPGLMIFRKFVPEKEKKSLAKCDTEPLERTDVLFVFVVGETPTGGIHKTQFKNALKIAREIKEGKPFEIEKPRSNKSEGGSLEILGPTFSGSLLSLSELLGEPGIIEEYGKVLIRSGTVTSFATVEWFNQQKPDADFATFQESDIYTGCRFLHWASARGYTLREIAALSEGETAYGKFTDKNARARCFSRSAGPKDPDDKDFLRIYFPREISQLRSAYQHDLPVQLPEVAGKGQPRSTLPLNLADTGKDEDSIPPYARLQYPLSQEAVLLGITTALRAHHSRFVLIRATDPLDLLFLARYLRMAYPQGRIVTFGADMLFQREVEDNLLHGIMAITTYSLLPRADDGIEIPELLAGHPHVDHVSGHPHVDHVFPDSYSAGTYNAMLSLLAKSPASDGGADVDPVPYTEYGWPELSDQTAPPGKFLKGTPWLTVLGRGAYWPMALLDTFPRNDAEWNHSVESGLHVIKGGAPRHDLDFKRNAPTPWVLLCGLGCLLVVVHLVLTWGGSIIFMSNAGANLAPVRNGHRTYLVMVADILFIVFMLLLLWPWEAWRIHLQATPASWMTWLAFSLLAFGSFFDLWRRGARISARVVGVVAVLGLIAVTWGYRFFTPSDVSLFLFRYIHVTSGISPLPACLMLLGAGLWWAWYSLAGTALLDDRRPRLPTKDEILRLGGELLGERLFYITEEGNKTLLGVMRPTTWDFRVYLPAFLVGFVAIMVMGHERSLQTLEGRTCDAIFALALLAVVLLLVTTLARLMVAWLECRRLLSALDRLPLRRGFQRLEGFSWQPIWSLGGTSLQDSYRLIALEQEALAHLKAAQAQADFNAPSSPDVKEESERLRRVTENFIPLMKAMHKQPLSLRGQWRHELGIRRTSFHTQIITGMKRFQTQLASTCGGILTSLISAWGEESGLSLPEPKHSKDSAHKTSFDQVPPWTLLREQFVCLVYVNFILSVLLRLRTLIAAAAGIFVFLLLSVSVYPLEPKLVLQPLLILLFFTIVFVVGAVYAQMHRNATLSRITSTNPGELGGDFWLRIGGFLILPLVSLLVSQFPDISNVLFSWLQPAVQALNH
jgi:hypothetical protein